MKTIKWMFWFVWGLPQNIVGLALAIVFIFHPEKKIYRYKSALIIDVPTGNHGAVSLGQFIFIFSRYSNVGYIERHEYGHTIQSHLLGPLYLLVIGLPSIIWNKFFGDYRKTYGVSYYDFWVEKWANKLGGNL